MCGIGGLILPQPGNIGDLLVQMLSGCQHRGPDSTGFAVYGEPGEGDFIMRVKVAERDDMDKGHGIHARIEGRIADYILL